MMINNNNEMFAVIGNVHHLFDPLFSGSLTGAIFADLF